MSSNYACSECGIGRGLVEQLKRKASMFDELVEALERAKKMFRKENLWREELYCQQVLTLANEIKEKEND